MAPFSASGVYVFGSNEHGALCLGVRAAEAGAVGVDAAAGLAAQVMSIAN